MTDGKLVVDLRGRLIETLSDFWDAVSEPCGLPEWFGRNLLVRLGVEAGRAASGASPAWPAVTWMHRGRARLSLATSMAHLIRR
ncbi:hypothetical protein [Streptomyces erythrochromogenes]|uniref:hypothetical protein n=1 Tax=Streptomyces erythrochromogenes TaxID=285574 RepID=UPI0038648757|nr:hypothetical protein OG364_35510 [Streptomyces erythrochromogenes]